MRRIYTYIFVESTPTCVFHFVLPIVTCIMTLALKISFNWVFKKTSKTFVLSADTDKVSMFFVCLFLYFCPKNINRCSDTLLLIILNYYAQMVTNSLLNLRWRSYQLNDFHYSCFHDLSDALIVIKKDDQCHYTFTTRIFNRTLLIFPIINSCVKWRTISIKMGIKNCFSCNPFAKQLYL